MVKIKQYSQNKQKINYEDQILSGTEVNNGFNEFKNNKGNLTKLKTKINLDELKYIIDNYLYLINGLDSHDLKNFKNNIKNIDIEALSNNVKKSILHDYIELKDIVIIQWQNSGRKISFQKFFENQIKKSALDCMKIQLYTKLIGKYNGKLDSDFGTKWMKKNNKDSLSKKAFDNLMISYSKDNYNLIIDLINTINITTKISKDELQQIFNIIEIEGFDKSRLSNKVEIYINALKLLEEMLKNGYLIENKKDYNFLINHGYIFTIGKTFNDFKGKIVEAIKGKKIKIIKWNNSRNDDKVIMKENNEAFKKLSKNILGLKSKKINQKEKNTNINIKKLNFFINCLKLGQFSFSHEKGKRLFENHYKKYEDILLSSYKELLTKKGIKIEEHFIFFIEWCEINNIKLNKNNKEQYIRKFFDTLKEKLKVEEAVEKNNINKNDPNFNMFKVILRKEYPELFIDKEGITIEEHYALFLEQYESGNIALIHMRKYFDNLEKVIKKFVKEKKQVNKPKLENKILKKGQSNQISGSTIKDKIFKNKSKEKTGAYDKGNILSEYKGPDYDLVIKFEKLRYEGNFFKKPRFIYKVNKNNEYGHSFSPVEKRLEFEMNINRGLNERRKEQIIIFFNNLSNKVAQKIIEETGINNINKAVNKLKNTKQGREKIIQIIARSFIEQNVVYKEEESLSDAFNPNSHFGNVVHMDCNLLVEGFMHIGQKLGLPLFMELEKEHAYAIWDNGRDSFEIEATSFRAKDITQKEEGGRLKITEILKDSYDKARLINPIGWHKNRKKDGLSSINRNKLGYYSPIKSDIHLSDLIQLTLSTEEVDDVYKKLQQNKNNNLVNSKLISLYEKNISLVNEKAHPIIINNGFDKLLFIAFLYLKNKDITKAENIADRMEKYYSKYGKDLIKNKSIIKEIRERINIIKYPVNKEKINEFDTLQKKVLSKISKMMKLSEKYKGKKDIVTLKKWKEELKNIMYLEGLKEQVERLFTLFQINIYPKLDSNNIEHKKLINTIEQMKKSVNSGLKILSILDQTIKQNNRQEVVGSKITPENFRKYLKSFDYSNNFVEAVIYGYEQYKETGKLDILLYNFSVHLNGILNNKYNYNDMLQYWSYSMGYLIKNHPELKGEIKNWIEEKIDLIIDNVKGNTECYENIKNMKKDMLKKDFDSYKKTSGLELWQNTAFLLAKIYMVVR